MVVFKDQKNTKTDDVGYLVEVFAVNLLPYFFTVIGAGIVFTGAVSNKIPSGSRIVVISAGTGLTSAGLAVANPQREKRRDNSTTNNLEH